MTPHAMRRSCIPSTRTHRRDAGPKPIRRNLDRPPSQEHKMCCHLAYHIRGPTGGFPPAGVAIKRGKMHPNCVFTWRLVARRHLPGVVKVSHCDATRRDASAGGNVREVAGLSRVALIL